MLDWTGGGGTDDAQMRAATRSGGLVRYGEDIASYGHDKGYQKIGITVNKPGEEIRGMLLDRRAIGADYNLGRTSLIVRRSVLGLTDQVTRTNSGLIAAYGFTIAAVKSAGYASWFTW